MKKWFSMLVLGALAVVLAACGGDATGGSGDTVDADKGQAYTFKLGHEAADSHIKFKVAEKFAEELEKIQTVV